ncbi:MAG: hypothetical protein WAT41_00045 [Flavobacteriales bacterium]
MTKQNNPMAGTNNAKNDAGIEVDGAYLPDHAPVDQGGSENVEEPTASDPAVAEALSKGRPEVPETTQAEALTDEDLLSVGIQTGQTARGSYSTDQSTGGGGYHDHRAGQFGTDPVAQPNNDEEVEPDPVDKGF